MRSIIVSLGLALSPSALAYGPCDADAEKLCASEEFHAETEKNCLHFNADKIQDSACKEFIGREAAAWKKTVESFQNVRNACKAELEKNCPELLGAERKLKAQQTCLMSSGEKLGADCKKDLNRHIREHQAHLREIP